MAKLCYRIIIEYKDIDTGARVIDNEFLRYTYYNNTLHKDNMKRTYKNIIKQLLSDNIISKYRFAVLLIAVCMASMQVACSTEKNVNVDTADYASENITIEEIPEYDGRAYVEINENEPEFSDSDKQVREAFEYYSDLDSYGRCGQAYANICPETEPKGEREAIGHIKPSGWHTVKYNDIVDGNYLYNRCHLIGYQLAGENDNEKNLITGTRYLNVSGMLQFEDEVADYVENTGNHVLYRVTPVFEEDNLVASGVQMEGWSVEDSGEGVCFNVYCYNVQPEIEIDYSTGESSVSETQNEASDYAANKDNTEEYIINTGSGKFHKTTCSSVSDMAEHNKVTYSGTKEELIESGYSPCKRCIGA